MRPTSLLAMISLLLPCRSGALQLHWSSGATDLTFSTATRCTLVVESDANEAGLPQEWRLLWVAKGCPTMTPIINLSASDGEIAEATETPAPNLAEQAGHTQVALFRSPLAAETRVAYVYLDLPGQAAGKFRVVALGNGTCLDDRRIEESNEVTFNGGLDSPLPSAILGAEGSHPTATLTINSKGVGLSRISRMVLTAPDTVWTVPLGLSSVTDTTLVATATVSARLPENYLLPTDGAAGGTSAVLAAEADDPTASVKGNSWLIVPEDPAKVIPKDFAFVYNSIPPPTRTGRWDNLFHIFYIRHNVTVPTDGLENSFGHLWSRDMEHWSLDTLAFVHGDVGFDKLHVWAPSIIQSGPKFHMFYTGVDSVNDQRTMRVATANLDTTDTDWTVDGRTPVFTAQQAPWVEPDPGLFSGQTQLRDPYVFPDPDSLGRFLMVYTALDDTAQALATGLARNHAGTMDSWANLGRYGATQRFHTGINQLESPHVFADSVSGWRIMFTAAENGTAFKHSSLRMITTAGTTPSDTSANAWSGTPTVLFNYLSPDTTVSGWVASEQLRVGHVDFLAAQNGYNFDGIHIARMYWTGNDFRLQVPNVTAVDLVGAKTKSVHLSAMNYSPRAGQVTMRIELPEKMAVKLVMYDVLGRVVCKLVDKELPAGATTVRWDRSTRQGATAASGVYFACLSYATGTRTLQLPVVR